MESKIEIVSKRLQRMGWVLHPRDDGSAELVKPRLRGLLGTRRVVLWLDEEDRLHRDQGARHSAS